MQKSSTSAEGSQRWWDIPSAVLIFLLILLAGTRLTITLWTPGLPFALDMGTLGVLLGFALGKSRFGKTAVAWIAAGYTLTLIPNKLISELDQDIYLGERLISTGDRLLLSMNEFLAGQPVKDYLLFVAFLCIVYWFVGLAAGYNFVRHGNFLAATLPAGILMFIIQIYDGLAPTRAWLVGFYLFLCLLLLGRQQYLVKRDSWTRRRVQVSTEIVRDLSAGMVIGAAVIVITAWNIPQIIPYAQSVADRWDRIAQPWDRFLERMNDAVASIENEGGVGGGEYYGSELTLGASNPSSTDVVFTALTMEENLFAPRLYWRSRVYDLYYEDGRWANTSADTIPFPPSAQEFDSPDTAHRTETEFAITVLTEQQPLFFFAAQPTWVSRPAKSLGIGIPDGGRDIFTVIASPSLRRGETYRMRAAIANPTIEELRGAGEDYPDWVRERYLQLPANFSPRMQSLAKELSNGLSTPYDKVNAITNHLRGEIEYSASIEIPANVTDRLDYVVFDLKQGFCTYYASAEVLMLRSAGIPARLAVGYAQGEVVVNERGENITTKYTVRRKDAHAWPEVYFPGYGWIEFEPTGNQGVLIRPEREGSAPPINDGTHAPLNPLPGGLLPQEDNLEATGASSDSAANPNDFSPYVVIGALLILLLTAWFFANRKYSIGRHLPEYISQIYIHTGSPPPVWIESWARWAALSPIERDFQSVNMSLRLLHQQQPVHVTPKVRAETLIKALPEARESIEALEAEHRAELFTPRPGNSVHARRAAIHILHQALRKRIRSVFGYN